MKLGLENIRKLLETLGNPHEKYLKIQIAGTNGKGSVCAFLDAICNSAGVKAGVFTSPHLMSITERVRINGKDISEIEFARLATRVREASETMIATGELDSLPTFFEQVTAIALLAFAEADVEVAILETGLGGRLDATTAANAEIAAITSISIDHQEYLGETLAEIAAEKAAIIHAGSRVVIGQQGPEVMDILLTRCSHLGITALVKCEPELWSIGVPNNSAVAMFRTEREVYSDASLGLSGRHQLENACTAILVAEVLRFDFGLNIDVEVILDGLENARHPGRMEFQGKYLFDGAHNVGGAIALGEFLDEFVAKPITMVFGAMKEKNSAEILRTLLPKIENVVLTRPNNERAMTAGEIAQSIDDHYDIEHIFLTETVADAIEKANHLVRKNGTILVTGSLYLVGEAKKIVNN